MSHNDNEKSNNSTVDSQYVIVIDLSNTRLKQVTICNKINPLYELQSNKIMLRLQKTNQFNSPIVDTIREQPTRVSVISVQNTKQRTHVPYTILGYLIADANNITNTLYEVDYKSNYGTRSIMTTMLYRDMTIGFNSSVPILIMYMDEEKQIRFIGHHYIMALMPSTNINLKLAAFFSNQSQYMHDYYSICEFKGNFNGWSNLLIHLNPQGKKMEPYMHRYVFNKNEKKFILKKNKNNSVPNNESVPENESVPNNEYVSTLPFMGMKVNLITINQVEGSAYCIRNVHPPNMVEEMRTYVNSAPFESLYSMKTGSSLLSYLLNEMKAGDFTQEYDRFIFFFMKQMDLLINFKNWIRHLADAIGVDAYISFVDGAGLNAQLNIMQHNSIQNMNLGIHTDYPDGYYLLYPSDVREKRKTARTILTYVDLYNKNQPVIGFTTRITEIQQKNAEHKLSDYSIRKKCENYLRLKRLLDEIKRIDTRTCIIINSFISEKFTRLGETIAISSVLEFFDMIDSILIPDIDDPKYPFRELHNILNSTGFDDREFFNTVNTIIKEAVDAHPDITNWNTKKIEEDMKQLEEKLYAPFTAFKNKIENLARQPNSTPFPKDIVLLDTKFKKRAYASNVEFFAIFMTDINYFMSLFEFVSDPKKLSIYLRDTLGDKTEYDDFVKGKACPFVDGGMVYFNGDKSHTLDAGVGKRISIVYKVSYVDRQPENPLSIEEREKAYFEQFEDAPFPIHTTKNNIGLHTGYVPMKVNVPQRARNFGGKQTIRRKRKQNRISRKKHVKK